MSPDGPSTFDDGAPFGVEVVHDGSPPRVRLRGEIDFSAVEAIDAAVSEVVAAGADRVAIDMAGVTFMDSSGITALVRARESGMPVAVHNPPESVRHVLDLTGLLDLLEVDDAARPT